MNWITTKLSQLSTFVAKTGQNVQFVAFFAHFSTAGYLMFLCPPGYRLLLAIVITIGAALKEYVFDAKEEHDPPQTFVDNTEDFISWSLGAWVTLLLRLYLGI